MSNAKDGIEIIPQDWHELADPEMIYWCARLNAIPGIETRQSCSGHKIGDISKNEGLEKIQTTKRGIRGRYWGGIKMYV